MRDRLEDVLLSSFLYGQEPTRTQKAFSECVSALLALKNATNGVNDAAKLEAEVDVLFGDAADEFENEVAAEPEKALGAIQESMFTLCTQLFSRELLLYNENHPDDKIEFQFETEDEKDVTLLLAALQRFSDSEEAAQSPHFNLLVQLAGVDYLDADDLIDQYAFLQSVLSASLHRANTIPSSGADDQELQRIVSDIKQNKITYWAGDTQKLLLKTLKAGGLDAVYQATQKNGPIRDAFMLHAALQEVGAPKDAITVVRTTDDGTPPKESVMARGLTSEELFTRVGGKEADKPFKRPLKVGGKDVVVQIVYHKEGYLGLKVLGDPPPCEPKDAMEALMRKALANETNQGKVYSNIKGFGHQITLPRTIQPPSAVVIKPPEPQKPTPPRGMPAMPGMPGVPPGFPDGGPPKRRLR